MLAVFVLDNGSHLKRQERPGIDDGFHPVVPESVYRCLMCETVKVRCLLVW